MVNGRESGRERQDGGETEEVGGKGRWREEEEKGGELVRAGREREGKGEDTLTVRFSTSAIEWAKHRHVMATLRARHKLFPKRDEPKWSYTDVSIREILTLPIRNMT